MIKKGEGAEKMSDLDVACKTNISLKNYTENKNI